MLQCDLRGSLFRKSEMKRQINFSKICVFWMFGRVHQLT